MTKRPPPTFVWLPKRPFRTASPCIRRRPRHPGIPACCAGASRPCRPGRRWKTHVGGHALGLRQLRAQRAQRFKQAAVHVAAAFFFPALPGGLRFFDGARGHRHPPIAAQHVPGGIGEAQYREASPGRISDARALLYGQGFLTFRMIIGII